MYVESGGEYETHPFKGEKISPDVWTAASSVPRQERGGGGGRLGRESTRKPKPNIVS